MTSPSSNAPALVTVTSSISAIDCGTFPGTYQVINYSASDTVWLSNSNSVRTDIGIPLQAQSAVTIAYPHLYACLDSSASGPVTIIIGSQIQNWSPSPVKVVDISGPVTVTGDVGIDGTVTVAGDVGITGPVTIDTSGGPIDATVSGNVGINGDVDANITGPVTIDSVTTNVNTISLVEYTALVTSSPQNSGTTFTLSGLHVYNSLLMVTNLPVAAQSNLYNQYAIIGVQTYADVAHTIPVGNGTFYQQELYGSTVSPNYGDLTTTSFPLNGADEAVFNFTSVIGTTTGTQTVTIYGVSGGDLPLSHRSQKYTPPDMYGVLNIPVTLSGGQVYIPLPITSNPVSVYAFLSGTSTGTVTPTISITDSRVGAQPFVSVGVTVDTDITWQLPHTLNPQYIMLQEKGTGTSRWQILVTEDKLAM